MLKPLLDDPLILLFYDYFSFISNDSTETFLKNGIRSEPSKFFMATLKRFVIPVLWHNPISLVSLGMPILEDLTDLIHLNIQVGLLFKRQGGVWEKIKPETTKMRG